MTPKVELRALYKRFGSVAANSDIDLVIESGTIHAVIGENGAGKSTAMKILYGMEQPDSGQILLNGQPKRWCSPSDAIASGIGMVHQHFMLAEPYDSIENIIVGTEKSAFRPIDRAGALKKLKGLSERYGLKVPFERPTGELPIGVRQRIEILKVLYREAQILILDEPTAVLTPQETLELFENLRKLKQEGKTIIIITHKLKEVMAISDRITVFRAGRVVANLETQSTHMDELASLMVGRKVNLKLDLSKGENLPGETTLEVRGLKYKDLQGVDLEVRTGEIVGIAGVEGNGQSELLQVLLHPRDFYRGLKGDVRFFGKAWKKSGNYFSTSEIKEFGVGVIPEDRHREGLLLSRPVPESFILGLHRKKRFSRWGMINRVELDRTVLKIAKEYDVRPQDPSLLSTLAGALSGGNQQKIIIAREFERNPKLLIASQPTRGVDVGAIEFIHRKILKARDQGMGVLLFSSELDEIIALSDRVLVIFEGRFIASFNRGEADEKRLGLAMGGVHA